LNNKSHSYKYDTIAVGGTFDIIHKGHEALLARAFQTGTHVVIGLTTDAFVSASGKKIRHNFTERFEQLSKYLAKQYPGRQYRITELDRTFGPGMFTSSVEAIAVSNETASQVEQANQKRRTLGLPDLKMEVVPLVLAQDGVKISSTRIRAGKIDSEGNPSKL